MGIKNAGDWLSPAGIVDGCLRLGIIAEGERLDVAAANLIETLI